MKIKMRKTLVLLSIMFLSLLVSSCSESQPEQSAEALVEKGCQSAGPDFDSTTSSYFFEASQINEKYRELSRAYINLTSLMKTVQNEEVVPSTRKALALLAQGELSIVQSFCGLSK
jgi:PBP1b-binding outer membrane lipoprotein LpoB